MLNAVTITGLDRKTSFEHLLELCNRYGFLEVAVLVGSQSHNASLSRFPSLLVVEGWKKFATEHNIPTAVHLCGAYSKIATQQIPQTALGISMVDVLRLCKGFGRVQVNLPSGFWSHSTEYLTNKWENLHDFADWVQCGKVILQHRGAWNAVPVRHLKVEYLFDKSGGRGEVDFTSWPVIPADPFHWPIPSGGRRWGYAGGLNPDNIHEAMAFLHGQPNHAKIWFDMETGVRSGGWLDLAKVEEVCDAVLDLDTNK